MLALITNQSINYRQWRSRTNNLCECSKL